MDKVHIQHGKRMASDLEMSMLRIIEKDKANIDILKHKVAHDTLTQISSRDELIKTYDDIELNNEIAGMLYIDVDKFKSINDTYGHWAGDEVLKVLGSRLKSHVELKDIVAREGGEEFVLILRKMDNIKVAERRAEELRKEIEENGFKLSNDTLLDNTISVGVSIRKPNELSIDWRNRTESACRIAKDNGRNQVVVAQSV